MSLEEKIGELFQLPSYFFNGDMVTGPAGELGITSDDLRVSGSCLSVAGAKKIYEIQKNHMEKHPHHIPMLFMADIINGYRTVFPIPLAQGCTFDPGWRRNALLSQPVKLPLQACMSPFRPWLIWYGTPAGGVSWNLRGRILI